MQKCFIGIDLGGTRVKLGLVCNGQVIDKRIITADSGNGLIANLPRLQQEIDALLLSNNSETSFGGIGMAFPGLVDPYTQRILSTNKKYDDAVTADLKDWVHNNWGVPFFLDNDARMAAVGEWKYGAGQDTENLVAVTIGTGIGTSAIIEGKLLRGKHFQAGCLGGHISVKYDGRKCTCGNVGCAEAYGSTWSLAESAKASALYGGSALAKEDRLDFESVFKASKNQDALAVEMHQMCIDVWAAALVNLIHAYDPEVIVVGGGALNNQDAVLPHLVQKVNELAWCPWGTVQIRPSTLMSNAGILGVVHCIQHKI